MPITQAEITKSKPGEKQYSLADGHGLSLVITTRGSKLWRYKYQFDGKQKMMALGTFPVVTLAEARIRHIFALKNGGYGCLFSLEGIESESCTDDDLDARTRDIEASLRGLPEGACLYQYTRVRTGFELPRQANYSSPVTESFAGDRMRYLAEHARLRRIDLFWCLSVELEKSNPFRQAPKEHRVEIGRQCYELEKAATILEAQLAYSLGLKLLSKHEAFRFFSYLFNLDDWTGAVHLRGDAGVDRQIAASPVEWHSDHLRVGRRYAQMFSLLNTPEISRPCLFANLLELGCDSILCSVWRPRSDAATRKEVSSQEKFLEFFKLSPFQRLMSGRNTAPLESSATAKAVVGNVESLTEVVSSLDKLSQGDYALRLLVCADTASDLKAAVPTVHRLFVDARTPIVGETFGKPLGGRVNRYVFCSDVHSDECRQSSPESPDVFLVMPNYFKTIGQALLRGRAFSDADEGRNHVAIVNHALAEHEWPGENPIGHRIFSGDLKAWATVVGEVGDVHAFSLDRTPVPNLYLPEADGPDTSMTIFLRTVGEPSELDETVRRALHGNSAITVRYVESMPELMSHAVAMRRFSMWIVVAFGLLALGLATLGTYAVLSYEMSLREREIGIRLALGSRRLAILVLLIRQEARWIGFGLAFGLSGAILVGYLLRAEFYRVGTASAPNR